MSEGPLKPGVALGLLRRRGRHLGDEHGHELAPNEEGERRGEGPLQLVDEPVLGR